MTTAPDITTTRLFPSGAIECSALMRDKRTGIIFFHRETFYGYSQADAKRNYRQSLRDAIEAGTMEVGA